MILVSVSRRSGMFEYIAIWSAQAAKAHPAGMLFLLQIATAVLSAFLDNVTTVLLIVPVTLAIVKQLDVPAYPYLFAEIFASNIGGTATLIGDPPNILIGTQVGLSFNQFVIHLTPVADRHFAGDDRLRAGAAVAPRAGHHRDVRGRRADAARQLGASFREGRA
jgi:Na+/H+ antiporter NhaD/arsenite permease-like protein